MSVASGTAGESMMKKFICSFSALALVILMLLHLHTKAAAKLDEIETYRITVDMQKDGTMDMTYHIDWKVLNDTSEGPLTWVEIGIPNQNVDNIKAMNKDISKIAYFYDGGDFVLIDLNRSYHANEIVPLDFSIHQSRMYTLDHHSNLCTYNFTPGWFDNSDVKSMTIRWNRENVQSSDAAQADGNYLVWKTSLTAGQHYEVSVNYKMGVFDTSDSEQAGEQDGEPASDDSDIGGIVLAVVIVGIIICVFIHFFGGKGGYRGGFGTHTFIGYGGHTSCACASSCACACACACAGGGRAGCSAKNLYGSVVKTRQLQEVLLRGSHP